MSRDYTPPVRPELAGQHPYGAPVLDVPVRLNVNENPIGPDAELVAAIAAAVAQAAPELNRYPDRDAVALRADLADYLGHGLTAANTWAGNGSNEVMAHLFAAFGGPGRSALTFTPTYSMYPEYARNGYTAYAAVPLPADYVLTAEHVVAAIAEHRPALTLIASPNNPTGIAVADDVVAAACEAGDGIVVLDEAYAEFRRTGTGTGLDLLADHPNLVVTRTMSKAFAFAGGRLGYLAADPAIVDALRVVRLPYHLSALTQVVARTALAHRASLLANVDLLRRERDAMAAWLAAQGLHVHPSDANFVLAGPFADRDATWQRLVDRGVLVRVVGPAGYLRISIGTPEENDAVRAALLEEWS
jgi:histidinol-phosphate aminotransferase